MEMQQVTIKKGEMNFIDTKCTFLVDIFLHAWKHVFKNSRFNKTILIKYLSVHKYFITTTNYSQISKIF